MATLSLTAEQMQEAVDAFTMYGSDQAAADALGLTLPGYKHRKRRGIIAGLDEAIVHAAPAGHRVKGVSTLYNRNGEVDAQWVKTVAGELPLEEQVQAIKDAFADWDIPELSGFVYPTGTDPELATIYPLADWHLGLLAWGKESGADWDLTIAQQTIQNSLQRVVGASPNSSEAVILGLGDLLHSDGYENTTAKSKNLLDVDGRWPKVLRAATDLVIYAVDLALQKHAHITVRILPGNHDEESAIAVSLALSLAYGKEERVTVDTDPSRFWWWRWGVTLLGATHGDKAKMNELPLLMAVRDPVGWGATKFRSIYTGHIHKDTGLELGGVKVESFQTPVAPDAWHSSMGYGAGRSLSSITHHKQLGEVSRSRANIIV